MKKKIPRNKTFCLMWTKHDWCAIFPARSGVDPQLNYPGKVTPATFDRITDLLCEKYCSHPNHFRMGGKPFFSIYQLDALVESFGGERETAAAFGRMRRTAGHPPQWHWVEHW